MSQAAQCTMSKASVGKGSRVSEEKLWVRSPGNPRSMTNWIASWGDPYEAIQSVATPFCAKAWLRLPVPPSISRTTLVVSPNANSGTSWQQIPCLINPKRAQYWVQFLSAFGLRERTLTLSFIDRPHYQASFLLFSRHFTFVGYGYDLYSKQELRAASALTKFLKFNMPASTSCHFSMVNILCLLVSTIMISFRNCRIKLPLLSTYLPTCFC